MLCFFLCWISIVLGPCVLSNTMTTISNLHSVLLLLTLLFPRAANIFLHSTALAIFIIHIRRCVSLSWLYGIVWTHLWEIIQLKCYGKITIFANIIQYTMYYMLFTCRAHLWGARQWSSKGGCVIPFFVMPEFFSHFFRWLTASWHNQCISEN